ncbi:MAG: DUF1353 domain-containing protein [Marinagarivorans sp.]
MFSYITRRALIKAGISIGAAGSAVVSQADQPPEKTASDWLEQVLSTKSLDAPLQLSRFVEPIYYTLKPFTWTPNKDNGPSYSAVTVPEGFITDLASIPRALFSVLRPDGEYAQAAIVHDYLYWTQRTTREYADDVFRIAMRDLEVSPPQITFIIEAVKEFGDGAWKQNQKLKEKGERRFLKEKPTKAVTRWKEWKRTPEHFYPNDL